MKHDDIWRALDTLAAESGMSASGLAQWGPPVSKDFLGISAGRDGLDELRSMLATVRAHDNEFTLARLRGLLKVATS